MDPGAAWTLPAAPDDEVTRVLYVFEGPQVAVDGTLWSARRWAPSSIPTAAPQLVAGDAEVEMMLLQGRPIAEPVAQYGPFVMNTEDEIRQAMVDYQQTQFGGWPWPEPDPVHNPVSERFARHADGRVEGVVPS